MKRNYFLSSVIILGLMLAGGVMAFDKEAYYNAVEAYESGIKISDAQLELLRNGGYNFISTVDNELDEMGGPDLWGYYYIDSSEDGGPVYAWNDISGTGTEVTGQSDDDFEGPVALPWSFPFYDNTYTDVYIGSNGYIAFGAGGDYTDFSNDPIPSVTTPNNYVAPFWDDLYPPAGGSIYYGSDLDGNFVITYDQYPSIGNNEDLYTFQVILYENGDILFQYSDMDPDDIDSETIGIENSDATIGLQCSYAAAPVGYPYNELAILIYPGDAPEPDADVEGYVTDDETGDGIEGASVTIGGENTTTDVDGYYMISGMFPGEYPVTISAMGYFTHNGDVTLVSGMNMYDASLLVNDPEGDVLIWDADTTPGSATEIANILNDMGLTTYYTTDIFADEVELTGYEYVFCFFGIFPNYFGVLTGSDAETALIDYLDAGGNLYIESSDLWGFNNPDNLMPYFHMGDVSDGTGDLSNVTGVAGTFTEGFMMAYTGENNWIDHIPPGNEMAWSILTNEEVLEPYTCGTLTDGGTYKCASFSFELGNLTDGENGTRAEIVTGVMEHFGWMPGPDVILTATPVGGPIVIDPPGTFQWDAYLENISGGPLTFDAWTALMLPIGVPYGPLTLFTGLTLPDGGILAVTPTQLVPGIASLFPGTYTYYARIGDFLGDVIVAEDSFPFDVIPSGPAVAGTFNTEDWVMTGFFELDELDTPELSNAVPSEYKFETPYPNPFNPTTTVSVGLPDVSSLTIVVTNVLGQTVAILANDYFDAGYHQFTFDARELSSGIYFVHAVVPGQMNQVQKVMLMK